MYNFAQSEQKQNNTNLAYSRFMDAINIASFLIGLQNLDLNITANDIDNQTQVILDDLHKYLDKQDKHLQEQDERLNRLEMLLYSKDIMARKEQNKQ